MYSFYRFATVKMGIHLCYKWDKPKSMVKVVNHYSNHSLDIKFSAQKLD